MRLADIKPDPNQPRKIFDEESLKGLAASIKKEGLINPIEVDPTGMIITGERRYRACKLLQLEEVAVQVNTTNLTPYDRLRRQIAENYQRSSSEEGSGMNAVDTARALSRLLQMKGHSGKWKSAAVRGSRGFYERLRPDDPIVKLGNDLGIKREMMRDFLGLLEEPRAVLESIEKGFSPRWFQIANEIGNKELINKLKRKILSGGYTSRGELEQDKRIMRAFPELQMQQVTRIRKQESSETNKILDCIVNLALALEAISIKKIHPEERGIVRTQVSWITTKLIEYLN